MTTYILKPRIPGGAWIATLLTVIGIGMILGSIFSKSSALRTVGVIAAVVGIGFLFIIIVAMRRMRVTILFDDEGYTVESPRGEYSGSWIDVSDVLVAKRTAKIALCHASGRRTIIAHPARRMDDEFMKVREGIRGYIEASLPQE